MSEDQLPPSRTAEQYVLRFEEKGMRDRLHEVARANGRSLNAELNARLRLSLEGGFAASELRQENEVLKAQLDLARHLASLNEFAQHLLAQLVLDLHRAMPPRLQEVGGVAVRAKLARSILEKDGEGMAQALALLLDLPAPEREKLEAEMRAVKQGNLIFRGFEVVDGGLRAVAEPALNIPAAAPEPPQARRKR